MAGGIDEALTATGGLPTRHSWRLDFACLQYILSVEWTRSQNNSHFPLSAPQ